MAGPSQVNLTMAQGNDETIAVTVTAASAGEDLTGVDSLEVFLKPDACTDDDGGEDAGVLVLTTALASEVVILSQTADVITAEAYVPAAYLADPYQRVWRVDAIGTNGDRRTAMHGSVTVVDT